MRNDFSFTPQMMKNAEELGHDPSRLPLLLLVPFLQVAWAEGAVQTSEQRAILDFAKRFNLGGHSAYERLLMWFDERPSDDFFDRSIKDLRDLLDRLPAKQAERLRSILRFGCHEVAHACGPVGFLRGGSNVDRAEREQLLKLDESLGLRPSIAC